MRSGSSTEVDAVVVGGGAAGLASALWLARYRRSVVVLDSGDYRAAKVEASHGYLGRDPQTPLELLERGREELLRYPTATLVQGRAESVVRRADGGSTWDHCGPPGGPGLRCVRREARAAGVRRALPCLAVPLPGLRRL